MFLRTALKTKDENILRVNFQIRGKGAYLPEHLGAIRIGSMTGDDGNFELYVAHITKDDKKMFIAAVQLYGVDMRTLTFTEQRKKDTFDAKTNTLNIILT